MNTNDLKARPHLHPKEIASVASLLTFFYTLDLFKKGCKKKLLEGDLYEAVTSCKSKELGDSIEAHLEHDKKKNRTPCLFRALLACFGKKYLLLGVVQLISKTILLIVLPEVLGRLISFYTPSQTQIKKQDAWYYGICIIFIALYIFLYNQNYFMLLNEMGIRIKTAICTFVFRKALRMTERSLSKVTMGKIVTIFIKDVHNVELLVLSANDMWIGLVQTVIICYLTYGKIGVAAFSGVGFIFAILPIQALLVKVVMDFRFRNLKTSDKRLHVTQELLSNIKTIKMYAWEAFFEKKITLLRK